MAERVYLHVGTMKAATTYLQALLDDNTDFLAESGWLWSGTSPNRRAVGDLIGPSDRFPGDEGAWPRFAKEARRFDGDVLISVELLAPLEPPKLTRLVRSLGDAERHVILTARELTRVIPSQWQEGMQDRRPAAWTQYVDEVCTDHPATARARYFWRAQDLARIMRAWSAVAPYERISLVTVPPPGGDPTLVWRRFSSVLGLDGDLFLQPEPQNESLGAVSAELMRRVNAEVADLEGPVYRWGFRRTLAKRVLSARAKSEPGLTLPAERHAWVRARSERMLGEVETLGVTVVGDLQDLVPPPQPRGDDIDPAHVSAGDLLAAATDGLVGLGTGFGELRAEHELLIAENEQAMHERDQLVQQRDQAIQERDQALEKLAELSTPPIPPFLRQRVRQRIRRHGSAHWLVHRLRAIRAAMRRH